MAGFVDVLLRGVILVGGAVALGGVVFLVAVLRVPPDVADGPARGALRLVTLGALVAGVAQLAVGLLALGALVERSGLAVLAPYARTSFALVVVVRLAFAFATVVCAAVLARGTS